MSSLPKNIVICLDGTGNQIEENLSNVLKLYRALKKDEKQVVFYDQGVGTLGQVNNWGRKYQEFKNLLSLAFGMGLDDNVIQAYEFIVQHYNEYKDPKTGKKLRDQIYIFGFSRGAHTARVLAGLLYEVGIIKSNQIHLSGAALTAYKQSELSEDDIDADAQDDEGKAANFKRLMKPYSASVRFLGVWDTVSSVLVPNAKGFWPPLVREKLPHTNANPAVRIFRHAISVDERRRMFRVDHWEKGQFFKPTIYIKGKLNEQDAKEVWFSGFHSDVGGGYKRLDSGLSQFPFIWMYKEAKVAGLKLNLAMAKYVSGEKNLSKNTHYLYPKPEVTAPLHNSMNPFWRILEFIPKHVRFREWPFRKVFLNYYLPRSEPRFIQEDADIHPSVFERIDKVPDYDPINIKNR